MTISRGSVSVLAVSGSKANRPATKAIASPRVNTCRTPPINLAAQDRLSHFHSDTVSRSSCLIANNLLTSEPSAISAHHETSHIHDNYTCQQTSGDRSTGHLPSKRCPAYYLSPQLQDYLGYCPSASRQTDNRPDGRIQ